MTRTTAVVACTCTRVGQVTSFISRCDAVIKAAETYRPTLYSLDKTATVRSLGRRLCRCRHESSPFLAREAIAACSQRPPARLCTRPPSPRTLNRFAPRSQPRRFPTQPNAQEAGRGGGNRTPSGGFGDRWFTVNRRPYKLDGGFASPASLPDLAPGLPAPQIILPLAVALLHLAVDRVLPRAWGSTS